LELANHSKVVSLPGKGANVRGYPGVKLVIIDEAAFTLDELFTAVSPMLIASRGRLVALSSPYGQRGWFHQQYTDPRAQWERYEVTASDCPRIRAEDLEEERIKL